MSRRDPSDEELSHLAAALGGLAPRGGLNRERLMYLAGQAATETSGSRTGRWAWPMSTAALVLLSATLAALLTFREPQMIERVVYVPAHISQPTEAAIRADVPPPRQTDEDQVHGQPHVPFDAVPDDEAPPAHGLARRGPPPQLGPQPTYGQLREAVLTWGVDVLPERAFGAGEASSPSASLGQRELLKALLEEVSPHHGDAS